MSLERVSPNRSQGNHDEASSHEPSNATHDIPSDEEERDLLESEKKLYGHAAMMKLKGIIDDQESYIKELEQQCIKLATSNQDQEEELITLKDLMQHFLQKMRSSRSDMIQHENMGVLLEQYFRSIEVFSGNKISLTESLSDANLGERRKSDVGQSTDRGGTGYHQTGQAG